MPDRRAFALLALGPGGCLIAENPAFDHEPFAFAVIADSPASAAGARDRALAEIALRPEVRFVLGAGDLAPAVDVHASVAALPTTSDSAELAYFPALGTDELATPADLDAWAGAWAQDWDSGGSRLAQQLPGATAFYPGPAGASDRRGTSYAFEYKGALFVVLDTYEHGATVDGDAGIWPGSPQLDWLEDVIDRSDAELRIAIGHVPLDAACYGPTGLCHWWVDCDPGRDVPWNQHSGALVTDELLRTLAQHDFVAYFHGHDNLQGRMLLDAAGARLFERLVFDVFDECAHEVDPFGTPSQWEDAQRQPGRLWQVDVGGITDEFGSYAITTVGSDAVTFELFVYITGDPSLEATRLWDTWTLPR